MRTNPVLAKGFLGSLLSTRRFKGLEYQKLATTGESGGVLPRTAFVEQHEKTDSTRYERELRKSRNQLFVATTRARDAWSFPRNCSRGHWRAGGARGPAGRGGPGRARAWPTPPVEAVGLSREG
ncbi:hypothetical protein ACFW22_01930, partial [Streptomyces sp. NPDC058872]